MSARLRCLPAGCAPPPTAPMPTGTCAGRARCARSRMRPRKRWRPCLPRDPPPWRGHQGDHVGEDVHEHVERRKQHDNILDHRNVTAADRIDEFLADAREVEYVFHDYDPAGEVQESEP